MDSVKIIEKPTEIDWDYDQAADVLYVSLGAPRPAVGIDLGNGVVMRYDESAHEIVGVTLIGLRERLAHELAVVEDGTHPQS